ncbi:MAG TPA: nuclear transport factor 2 family protein [Gaiellales bacterium]|jgi:hypothetical protein|nr:nuclear transport factor 2 family protein [Gaiellales bacterium]
MPPDAVWVTSTYFESWKARDFDTLRLLLADDVTFDGPLAHLDNADDCINGLQEMSKIVTDIVVRKVWVDGDDVLTWFELHTSVARPKPTANWSKVQNGKITSIRVVFDARGLAPS